MTARDLLYVLKARTAGARYAWRIVGEARRAGVPLSWAFALVEQESAFQNIFGHDVGSILHGLPVTKARVTTLLHYRGPSNGVGLTQLTSRHLIMEANRLGGAHKPRYQLRVGLAYLKTVTKGHYATDAWKYNGSRRYQAWIVEKQRRWHKALT